jgi:iron complex outermembrane receptor protein
MPALKGKNRFLIGVMASHNFRFPTLNDLYWIPGGNPNLKEEKSINGELQAKYSYGKWLDVSLSNFYIYAQDWIQWIPQGPVWQAENFRRVFSRGLEATIHLSNGMGDNPRRFGIHFNASYTYTKATNLDGLSATDLSKGKQLIYTPYHNLSFGLQLQYQRFYLRSVNTFTGAVYTSTDNSQTLQGYFIPNLEAGKDFVINHLDVGLSFRVNNLGNAQYQAVAQRPMPGRNFEGTLRFKFFN